MDTHIAWQFYTFVPSVITMLLLVSIATQLGPLYARRRTDDMIFIGMLVVLMGCSLTDLSALCLYAAGFADPWMVARVSTTASMLLYLVFIYLWALFIDFRMYGSRTRIQRLRGVALTPLFLVFFLIVFNHFTEGVFRIRDDGSYEIRPFWLLYVAVQLGYVVATSVFLQKYKKTFGGLHFFPVKSFVIPFVAGTIGEMLMPGMSLPTVGASLGYLFIYFGMLRENIYEDPVTGFYNTFFLERISEEAAAGTFDFSSGILLFADGYDVYLANNGVVATNRLMRREARVLRDELPEGCETMHIGGGSFLILSKVSAEQEAALMLLIETAGASMTADADGALSYQGCFAYRSEGEDPGSVLSALMEKAGKLYE